MGLTSSALLLFVLSAADAAPAPEAERLFDLPIEDLLQVEIRSAGKRDEQVRDIPASVTVLTREEIQRYGWVTFEEALAHVPGFFLLDTIDERPIGTRGIVGGSVQVLIDGVPQNRDMPLNIPVESIDRLEVIRGPMSVIYGNNAFLGVINVVTNEIGRHGPRVSAGYGSRNSGRVFARVGKQTDDGFLALNAGGYRTDGLAGRYANMMGPDQLAGLVPGMHDSMDGDMPLQDTSLDLSAGWGDWSAALRWAQRDFGGYILTPSFDGGNRARLTDWQMALGWEHAIRDNLAFRARALVSEEDLDLYRADFYAPSLIGGQRGFYRRLELELNLVWEPRPDLSLLAGYRLRRMEGIDNRAWALPLLERTEQVGDFAVNDLFVDLGWNATGQLRLNGGLRVSRLPPAYSYYEYDGLAGTQVDRDLPVQDRNLVTGRVAALWSPDAHQVVKLIWGTAAQDNRQIRFTAPERIETAELVYVQTRPGWTLTASLFRNRISRILRFTQAIDPATGAYRSVAENTGLWTTNGLELIGELHPLPGLNLSASATWQHTEDQATGIDPGYSPALLGKLSADYTRGALTYAVDAQYVGGMDPDWQFADGPVPGVVARLGERVDPYWSLGANLRYRQPGNGLYADLNVSNLLDTEVRYPAKELADFERGLIGPGRVVTFTLGWAF